MRGVIAEFSRMFIGMLALALLFLILCTCVVLLAYETPLQTDAPVGPKLM